MTSHSLTVEGLSAGYGDRLILRGLDLAVLPGRITAIVGANACGKSTLLRSMSRLLAPRAGRVLLDGKAIHRMSPRRVAQVMGLLPQSPIAPEGITVADLVSRGRHPHHGILSRWSRADDEAVAQALDATGTQELAERAVDELSGGQRQRVWIAMALAQRTDDDERADAVELARRKLPSGPALQAQLADREAKQKLIRRMVSALARKGYAPGLAFEVVRGVLDDHGTGDDGLLEEPESL